ncbi:hypothetical protein [Variovorax sp.]|jgi:hypothetical protein|uniref:hypothetical protein n=1 Tax=Variovorax sp. TaxID=1871043 RepID=UPI004037BB7B
MRSIFMTGVFLLSTSTAFAQQPCKPLAFETRGVKATKSFDKIILTGSVSNGNPSDCGVQLRATSYDEKGYVVDTANFWPASTRNIPAGASEPFKYFLNAGDSKSFEIVPVSTKQWR